MMEIQYGTFGSEETFESVNGEVDFEHSLFLPLTATTTIGAYFRSTQSWRNKRFLVMGY